MGGRDSADESMFRMYAQAYGECPRMGTLCGQFRSECASSGVQKQHAIEHRQERYPNLAASQFRFNRTQFCMFSIPFRDGAFDSFQIMICLVSVKQPCP
jgi:hypothetical protein